MSASTPSGSPQVSSLLADREHLRATLGMLPVGVVIVDAGGHLLEANPSAEAVWGRKPLGDGPADYGVFEGYRPGSGERLQPHEWPLPRTLRSGQPVVNEEVEVVAFDGIRHSLLLSTTPLRDAEGALVGAVAVHMDITERRQAEHAEAFLGEATRLLVESMDFEDTLQAVARLATRHLADGCAIDVVGDDGQLHRLAVAARDPRRDALLREMLRYPPRLEGSSPTARVFNEGRSLLLHGVTAEHLDAHAQDPEHRRMLAEMEPRDWMVVPLSLGERRLGVIHFGLYTAGPHYTERELKYAEELARRAAFVVEHARLYREAQRALKARDTSLALLEAFLAASPVGMAFLDREQRFVHANPALSAFTGVAREDFPGHRPRDVLPEALGREEERLMRGVLESGEAVLDREFTGPPRSGGTSRSAHVSFFPVKVDGETLGVGATVLDTTEQKRVEEGLRFLAEATPRLSASLDLRTTLENTARLVTEKLADYCLVDMRSEDGRGLERVAVAARDPAAQPALLERLREGPSASPEHPIRQVLDTGQARLLPEVTESVLREVVPQAGGHGEFLPQFLSSSAMLVPLTAREHTLGVVTVVSLDPARRYTERDLAFMTELAWRAALAVDNARLFHQTEQAVAARDEFVAIATHELRTPLSALSLQLASLLRSVEGGLVPTPERLHQSLLTAQRQTERLEVLIHHLLDVSRLSTGRLELEREAVDLSMLVHRLVERLEQKLAEAGCVAVVRADAPVVARVDRLRVEQVLMNLLSNAMKYAAGQPVELSVEREQGMAVLGVRDYGPGISPEAQARIFERFERASVRHSRESLGLGLYVSRQIARAHGGELTVESTPGQGSYFLLRLPVG